MFHQILVLLATLLAFPSASSSSATSNHASTITTGLNTTGPAIVFFSIATALLLILLLRTSIRRYADLLAWKIAGRRVRKILVARSKDVLEDLLLPGAYGGLAHIDHAILTSGGIICILTKNYNGIIFGDADEPQWTNIDGIHRRKFLNPLIQNEGRTRALQKTIPDVPVANLVVFTGGVQFTSKPEKNIIHLRNLDSYIAKFVFGPCKIDDWDAVWLSVKSAAITGAESDRSHPAQPGLS